MPYTMHDVRLGEVYYGYLLETARSKPLRPVRYGALVSRARAEHPDDDIVQGAIPTSIGSRLLVIETFCRQNGLPNLACLAVNRKDEPGSGYSRTHDWETEKKEVAEFDWNSHQASWNLYISASRMAAAPPPALVRRTEEEAERVMVRHWKEDARSAAPRYSDRIDNKPKEKILKMLERGHAAEVAFCSVLGIGMD